MVLLRGKPHSLQRILDLGTFSVKHLLEQRRSKKNPRDGVFLQKLTEQYWVINHTVRYYVECGS